MPNFLNRLALVTLAASFSLAACSGGGTSPASKVLPSSPSGAPAAGATEKNPALTEYTIAPGDAAPTAITVAPNGNAWFLTANAVNDITPAGAVTPHSDIAFNSYNAGTDITIGPDGAPWFTANCSLQNALLCSSFQVLMVRVSSSGAFVVVAPAGDIRENVFQSGLAAGVNSMSAVVGFGDTINISGSKYEMVHADGSDLFAEPLPRPCANSPGAGNGALTSYSATGIARGADGAFYVTASSPCDFIPGPPGESAVLRIEPGGTVTNTFLVPDATRIAAGPDGNLWVTQGGKTNAIGRLTTSGTLTEFPLPTPNAAPLGITAGNDGAVWFTENIASKIGRITTAGIITEYPTPTRNAGPVGIASLAGACGPGHALVWFTENTANRVGTVQF